MDADNGWIEPTLFHEGHPQNPSNVTRIARAVTAEDDDHHAQIVYYQAGVGTGIGLYSHLIGGGLGQGLKENIREAYAFLASNYRGHHSDLPGTEPDRIFLIGFSRGAFTARSIGGLISALGLLRKPAMSRFYEIFQDWANAGNPRYTPLFFDRYFGDHGDETHASEKPDLALARDFQRIDEYLDLYRSLLLSLGLTQEVQIKCVGVWDTVGALGIPVNPIFQRVFPFLPDFIRQYSWFDTSIDRPVENAFQALALDERRYPYAPSLWEKPRGDGDGDDGDDGQRGTRLKQVWFPGAHSNVGGSYPDQGIADITLAWMMDQLAGHSIPDPTSRRRVDWIHFDWDIAFLPKAPTPSGTTTSSRPESKSPDISSLWSLTQIYPSASIPQTVALGTQTRRPRHYHAIDYQSGTSMSSRPLRHTCESVHSSVRARVHFRGPDVEPDWTGAIPRGRGVSPWILTVWRWVLRKRKTDYEARVLGAGGALEGWVFDDTDDKCRWVFGSSRGKSVKLNSDAMVMPEDPLGPFELKLLERMANDKMKAEVMVTNGVTERRDQIDDSGENLGLVVLATGRKEHAGHADHRVRSPSPRYTRTV